MKALGYFTAAVAIAALASCNDDLDMGGFAGDPNAVRISATVGNPLTRSNPVGDATSVKQFNNGDRISVSSSNQDAAVYEFNGTGWSPTIQDKYLTWNSNRQHFTVYYPDTYKGSGNVPQKQNTEELIVAADYMKYDGQLEKQQTVSFTMARQTARVIINSGFSWNDEYMKGGASTHKVDAIRVNCMGVSDIEPYQSGNYYALVNPGSADPDATFLTITVSPVDGQGAPVTHTVKGVPEFEPGYSYEYNITIGKSGVTISDVTVEDWSTGSIIEGEGSADDNYEYMFFFREEIKDNEVNFSYTGGSKNIEIASYVRMGNVSFVPLPWTAKFVRKLQDGTYEEIKQGEADYPTWIRNFTDKGIGDDTDNLCTVTVVPAEISNNHHNALKNAAPVSGIYNLSNSVGANAIENTANCYIVNAAGSYSFPLVYGNAIKNSVKNEASYKSTATGKNVLENFVNHKNAPISSPYIAAHSGCVPTNATLVWQDAENLVSNIQFVDGGSPEAHRITFDVAQSSIKQGNAIIAIRDAENTILWSWHIWVTDYKPLLASTITQSYDPTVTQRDKKVWSYDNKYSYTFMGVPLGWCDAEAAEGHDVIIQFTQAETGKTLEVTIKQDPLTVGGNCTYYQWGRKDPMLGSNGLGNVDKTQYGSTDYTFTVDGPGKVSVGAAIQNPHIYYNYGGSGYFDWCSNSGTIEGKSFLFNLWDTHNTSLGYKGFIKYAITTKTVYDPSPVGYVVPPNGAMNGLTYNGKNEGDGWSYRNVFNTPFTSSEEINAVNGWVFYCRGMNNGQGKWDTSGGVIYHPAVGFRDFDKKGNLNDVGVLCQYWSAVPYTDAIACTAAFNVATLSVLGDGATYRIHGEPVRPVRE